MRVKEGAWANFSCTVPCLRYGIKLYRAGIDFPSNYPDFGLNVTKQIPRTCNSNGEWTYFLGVLATRAANNTVIYCAAHSREIPTESPDVHCGCGCPGTDRCYSRPSLLTGMQLLHALIVLIIGNLLSCGCHRRIFMQCLHNQLSNLLHVLQSKNKWCIVVVALYKHAVEPTEDTETTPSPSPSFTSSCTPSLQSMSKCMSLLWIASRSLCIKRWHLLIATLLCRQGDASSHDASSYGDAWSHSDASSHYCDNYSDSDNYIHSNFNSHRLYRYSMIIHLGITTYSADYIMDLLLLDLSLY